MRVQSDHFDDRRRRGDNHRFLHMYPLLFMQENDEEQEVLVACWNI